MMLRKSGETACTQFQKKCRSRTYVVLQWLLLFSWRCLTPKVSAWQIFSLRPRNNFAQPPRETFHYYAFFLLSATAAPPSARLDGAAFGGYKRPGCRGRAADVCGGQGGRGRPRRPWPWKGLRKERVERGPGDFRALLWDVGWFVFQFEDFEVPILCWDRLRVYKRNDQAWRGNDKSEKQNDHEGSRLLQNAQLRRNLHIDLI